MLRSHRVLVLFVMFALLCFSVTASVPPDLANILIDREGLKITATRNFPKDLACDITFGSEKNSRFHAEGAHGKISIAMVNVDSNPLERGNHNRSVAVVRKQTEKELYVLEYSALDDDGKGYVLYDLNCNGEWDVKLTPSRQEQAFIRVANEWLRVDSVIGILATNPSAVVGSVKYAFAGRWTRK